MQTRHNAACIPDLTHAWMRMVHIATVQCTNAIPDWPINGSSGGGKWTLVQQLLVNNVQLAVSDKLLPTLSGIMLPLASYVDVGI